VLIGGAARAGADIASVLAIAPVSFAIQPFASDMSLFAALPPLEKGSRWADWRLSCKAHGEPHRRDRGNR
jgi:hypothetical protein